MAIDLSQAPGEVLLNGNYVWDTGSLSWVKETQSGGGGGGGAVTVADGADVAEGATTDAAVDTDTTGTISGKLRGLVKIAASVWDNINGRIKVDGSGAPQGSDGACVRDLSVIDLYEPYSCDGPGTQTLKFIKGQCVDTTDAPLQGVTVQAFRTSDDAFAGYEVQSREDGSYDLATNFPGVNHYVVAYLQGSPDRAGTTVNTLVPANIDGT